MAQLILLIIVIIFLNKLLEDNRKTHYRSRKSASKRKGQIGELRVSKQVEQLPAGDYLTIDDVEVSTEEGYGQIDHIIVSEYGIFVIETKKITVG